MVLAAVISAPISADQSEWIYLSNGSSYTVVSPATGDIVEKGILATSMFTPAADEPISIVPTPGGRYVFFLYPNHGKAIVLDAESHQVAWSVDLPAGTESIQFSSMGDSLYAYIGDGERITYTHSRGKVSGTPVTAPPVGPGHLAFNRRATRIYATSNGHLSYVLATSGETIKQVRLRGGFHDWLISPNFRVLLGSETGSAQLVLVDEQRAQIIGYLGEPFIYGTPQFSLSSREVLFLSSDGKRMFVADTRRFRVTAEIELHDPLRTLWLDATGAIHGISANGEAIVLNATNEPQRVAISEELIGERLTAAFVVLKPGQGFACF